ncbi:MAG TPA: hypothetical protein VFF04_05450 [Candidatus Babeliales bacterium]|nr:hypothetical protein [Candidatus Babeliales bacterium]
MNKQIIFAFLLIASNSHAAENHLLSPGAFDAEEEPVVTQINEDLTAPMRQRRICVDHRKCLACCACLTGLVVVIAAKELADSVKPKCLPIETSLYESCFSVSSNPDQSFCPFPGSAKNFLLSDRGRLIHREKNQDPCIKKTSCDGLGCSKKGKLN